MEETPRSDGGSFRSTVLMGRLAADYPELGAFPADATLMEIKVMYGLSTLAEVREMGRERGRRRASASGEPARQAGQVRPLTAG